MGYHLVAGWEALIPLDRARGRLAEQVTGALRDAIAGGRLAAGARLPSTRDLAADLKVSRGLVVAAYEQLIAEGRLAARRGSGTVVAAAPASRPKTEPPTRVDHGGLLRPGVPDLGMFPRSAWRRAYEKAITSARDADLDYGDPAGAPRLRTELASYLGRVRAARVAPEHVVVTTGAAQAFALLGRVLRDNGVRRVGVEDPGSAPIRDHFADQGVSPVPVPVDGHGLEVDGLGRLRAVVVTPAHQYPTGVVLAPERRAALVAWARKTKGLIIEDDYDAEFRYDREPVGCLQGLAPDAVALVGTVSKALAPGMRLGWLVAPSRHAPAALAAKVAADLGGPALEQLALAELLASGGYDRHLRRSRRMQRRRRDAVVEAVRDHLPGAEIRGVAAGLHLVLALPPGTDDVAVAARARAHGLAPVALSTLGTAPRPGLVIGYAAHAPDELRAAIARLAGLIR